MRWIDGSNKDEIRRARHACNDGYGGSGSGPFGEASRPIAVQSASSVMNAKHAFDPEFYDGSAPLFEKQLIAALKSLAGRSRP
ncbi:hypothetical protein [Methylobacterium sp. GC_Met_2]|uniref:hypothetical protein n=1 Tax=Methylobacterium sp. GC_Met_2 TaxID=2937376 RepID=UPI00226BB725|nr:hypothetical protein [Methylobacterium sp. GC_Met_2]